MRAGAGDRDLGANSASSFVGPHPNPLGVGEGANSQCTCLNRLNFILSTPPADKLYATAADRVLLCHPFVAMRDDKKPAEVVRETIS